MKTCKRILSLLMALVLVFTMLPVPAQATGSQPKTSVDAGDLTLEGTNGFGNLLSQEIQESQEESATVEEDYEAGYSVIDLTFDGTTATVEYSSLEEARLVVAVYSENGLQMLASGETTVSPEEDVATVTIEGDMPEYFMASAYLMDTYDMSPLCAAYDTPMYTQEMQELLESTVDDYDPERVLNLDEDKTTNFAVYAEDTIVIEPTDGVNTVRSVDDENATYVIENADEYITSLTAGDVFIYPYGKQEILIVKVGTIIIDGTTVTITGSELEIEEAFSYLKIETQSGMDEVIVDDSNLPEGLIYEGITGDDAGGITPHVDGEVSGKKHMDFTFEAFKDEETGTELNGTFDFTVKASVEYYLTRSYQRIEIKVSPAFSLEVEFKVTLSSDPIEVPILPIKMPFLFGAATIDFTPKLVGEFEVSITLTIAKVEATIGFYFDHGKNGTKFKPIYASSFKSFNIEAEGTFFIGLKLEPALEILGGAAAYAKISGEIGVYISAKYDPRSNASNQDVIHTCDSCWDGDVSLGIKTGAKLSVFSISKLSNSISFFDYKWKFADFYISYGNGGFGMGECPNHDYRITVYVTDSEGAPISGAEVTAYDGQMGITDDNGIAVFYLHRWAYFCHSIVARYGEKESWVNFVPDKAQKLYMTLSEDGESKNIFDSIIPDDYIDVTKYIASGKCGDKVHWTLSADGILSIAGKGAMYYSSSWWYNYRDNISSVIIGNGVTTIMSSAFSGCSGLTSVSIPNSVTAIGSSAFEDCTSLTSVKIPDRVTEIGNRTFMGCTNLTSIELPNNITTIGEYAFYNCTSLTSVEIPDGVTTIGEYTFYNCTCLTSLEVPDGVTAIGNGAFENCTKLTTVNIPDSVTTIAQDTFNGCIKLTSVEIPHSVTTIGASAFAGCDSLTTVKIPYGLTTIGSSAFEGCTSVKSAKFPNSVTMIGDHAFFGCTGLITVEIPSSITTIAAWTFAGCGSLTSVNIPNSVTTIEEYAFWECDSLTTVEIPNSVTAMGEAVFKNCDSLTTVEIPDSVTIIAAWIFSGCDSLTSVNIPSSVTIIAGRAFSDCDSLTSVDIPDSVTIIGADAFSSCGSLISVSIPDSVTTIEEYAFWACDSLVAIEIPSSVTTIGDAAFYADISLAEIVFYGDAPSIGEEVFAHVPATAYYPAGNSTWTYEVREAFCGYITWVPYTLDENGNMLFNIAAAVTVTAEPTEFDMPETTDKKPVMQTGLEIPTSKVGDRDETLNPNAVYNGEYSSVSTDTYTLKTASFSGLVPGEQYVLLAMVSIDVEDPLVADNLLYIDQAAALEDGTLVFQYVQRTPTETSYVVACGASNKDLNDAEITFPEMVADGETLIVNPTVVYDGQTLIEGQDYTIQGTVSVTEAGTYTCYIRGVRNYTGLVECTYTVTLVLGEEVASGTCGVNVAWSLYDKGTLLISGTGPMEDYNGAADTPWYDSRSSILRIIIEEGVTTISEYAFCDCRNMTSMTIPDDLMTIGDCAFFYCEKLTNASIPNSVTSIGMYAFSHCESLTDVSMGNGVISIGYGAFQECSNLASLRIPDSVTSIGKYAFYDCESLTDVSMGNGVSTIGDYAFSGCCDLTSIRLPEGVKSIGRDAFEYCYSLTSVTIPDSVTSIGRSAFAYCHSLTSVKIPNGVTSIGEEAFYYCENMATVIIGHSVATIYSNA